MDTTTKNKAMLQDLIAGGNGITGQWLEHVVYEATATTPEHDGYLLHTRDGGLTFGVTLDSAKTLHAISGDTEPLIIRDTRRRISNAEQTH